MRQHLRPSLNAEPNFCEIPMSQEGPMLITKVEPSSPAKPRISTRVEIIEISDSEDEAEGRCKAFANGNCRRQAIQKNTRTREDREPSILRPDPARRLRLSNFAPEHSRVNPQKPTGSNTPVADGTYASDGVVTEKKNACTKQDENDLNRREPQRSSNGLGLSTASSISEVSPSRFGRSSLSSIVLAKGVRSKSNSTRTRSAENIDTLARDSPEKPVRAQEIDSSRQMKECTSSDSTAPVTENVQSQKQFLKPPSPKAPLSKKEFSKMSLEDVDDLITKYGSSLIRNVTIKDIVGKGLSEINLPKNLKLTPQLEPKPQYKQPISADDEVIVISDSEEEVDKVAQEPETDSSPEAEILLKKKKYRAQADFLANLQLFHNFQQKKPMKKDITTVLRTRNNMKAYITNPLVNINKADCIYKYVTTKGFLTSEQFRAKRIVPRRKPRAKPTAETRAAARRALPPKVEGTRRSSRKRSAAVPDIQPQSFVRRFLTADLKQNIQQHEQNGVWTSYCLSRAAQRMDHPLIVLKSIDPNDWVDEEIDPNELRSIAVSAQAKERKCRWCPFQCLYIPSLREHCFEFHNENFPPVMS